MSIVSSSNDDVFNLIMIKVGNIIAYSFCQVFFIYIRAIFRFDEKI